MFTIKIMEIDSKEKVVKILVIFKSKKSFLSLQFYRT